MKRILCILTLLAGLSADAQLTNPTVLRFGARISNGLTVASGAVSLPTNSMVGTNRIAGINDIVAGTVSNGQWWPDTARIGLLATGTSVRVVALDQQAGADNTNKVDHARYALWSAGVAGGNYDGTNIPVAGLSIGGDGYLYVYANGITTTPTDVYISTLIRKDGSALQSNDVFRYFPASPGFNAGFYPAPASSLAGPGLNALANGQLEVTNSPTGVGAVNIMFTAPAQVITSTVFTKVQASTVTTNVGGYWDVTNYQARLPVGTYAMTAAASVFFNSQTGSVIVSLRRNGSEIRRLMRSPPVILAGSPPTYLAGGSGSSAIDEISGTNLYDFAIYQDSGATCTNISSAGVATMTIIKQAP